MTSSLSRAVNSTPDGRSARNACVRLSPDRLHHHTWATIDNVAGTRPSRVRSPISRCLHVLDGTGYLIASGSATPAVWRVTANATGFGYTASLLGNLSYDIEPTDLGSGDIAFDGEGIAWLSAGQDLYRIDFSAGLQAVRQARPLLNGVPPVSTGRAWVRQQRPAVRRQHVATGRYYLRPGTRAHEKRHHRRRVARPRFVLVPILPKPSCRWQDAGADQRHPPLRRKRRPRRHADLRDPDHQQRRRRRHVSRVTWSRRCRNTSVVTRHDFTCTGSNCPNTAAVNVAAAQALTLDFVVQVNRRAVAHRDQQRGDGCRRGLRRAGTLHRVDAARPTLTSTNRGSIQRHAVSVGETLPTR